MKRKIILALAALFTTLSLAWSAQVQRRYTATDHQIYVLDGFSTSLSPAISMPTTSVDGHRLVGLSVSFTNEVTTDVEFGYVRGGVSNIIYSESGTATTFSWEGSSTTGGWVIFPTDTIFLTSTNTAEAQVTLILED